MTTPPCCNIINKDQANLCGKVDNYHFLFLFNQQCACTLKKSKKFIKVIVVELAARGYSILDLIKKPLPF